MSNRRASRSSSPPWRRIDAPRPPRGRRLGDDDRQVPFDLREAADRGRPLGRQPPAGQALDRDLAHDRPARRAELPGLDDVAGAARRRGPAAGPRCSARAVRPGWNTASPDSAGTPDAPRSSRRASSSSRPFASSRSYGRAGAVPGRRLGRARRARTRAATTPAARRLPARSPCRSRTPPRPRVPWRRLLADHVEQAAEQVACGAREWSRDSGLRDADRRRRRAAARRRSTATSGRQHERLEVAGRHEGGGHDLGQAGAGERLRGRARAPRAATGGTRGMACRA